MTPDTPPTPEQRAEELDVAAKIARENGDLVFARECEQHAAHLRQQEPAA